MTKPKGQRKQFEVGKSYYRELPSNPNFAVVEECKKLGTEPYKLFQICEVIKRTKHFLTLKEGEFPNEKIYKKKIKIEPEFRNRTTNLCKKEEVEICQVGYYFHETIRANQPCQEYDL